MRPDVKLGVILSAVLVFVVGGYYLFSARREAPLPIASGPDGAGADKSPAKKPVGSGVADTTGRPTPATRINVNKTNAPVNAPGKRDPRVALRHPSPVLDSAPASPGRVIPSVADNREKGSSMTSSVATERARTTSTGDPAGANAAVADATPTSGASTVARAEPSTAPPVSGKTQLVGTNQPDGAETSPRSVADRAVPLTATPSSTPPSRNVPADRGAVETHRVQPGDTFSSLAQRYYGDKSLALFLKENNPRITDTEPLRTGEMVRIPARPAELAAASKSEVPTVGKPATSTPAKPGAGTPKTPSAGGQRTYQVKPGDSFYKIAKEQLGDSSRWRELFQLNKDRVGGDPTHLQVGQTLILPSK